MSTIFCLFIQAYETNELVGTHYLSFEFQSFLFQMKVTSFNAKKLRQESNLGIHSDTL
jgi:hypothetical protein